MGLQLVLQNLPQRRKAGSSFAETLRPVAIEWTEIAAASSPIQEALILMDRTDLKSWEIQVRKGLIEFTTLQIVAEHEGHGYEIVQRMRQLPGFEVTESAVYPILSRFRSEGALEVRSTPSSSGPPKNIYRITALGRTRLRAMRAFLRRLMESLTPMTEPNPRNNP
ncbi:MAG: PadR family transcriptional regulator [Chthoniobacterales bacterium]